MPRFTLRRFFSIFMLAMLLAGSMATSALTATFKDIDGPYKEAILWINGRGAMLGYNPTTFGTNDPLLREQAAAVLGELLPGLRHLPQDRRATAIAELEKVVLVYRGRAARGVLDLHVGVRRHLPVQDDVVQVPRVVNLDAHRHHRVGRTQRRIPDSGDTPLPRSQPLIAVTSNTDTRRARGRQVRH